MTPKKPARPQAPPTPAPRSEVTRTGPPDAPAAHPKADPGPPPKMPPQPATWPFGYSRIYEAGQARDRQALEACHTMREDPAMARYKAEMLQWLDDISAYEAARG